MSFGEVMTMLSRADKAEQAGDDDLAKRLRNLAKVMDRVDAEEANKWLSLRPRAVDED